MSKSTKFGLIGAVIGVVAAAVSASPLTIADLVVGGAATSAIGFFIGKFSEKNDSE